jgi:thioesterase domain-containing protein
MSSCLIPIKPSGNKRPFFYVHAADGHTIDSLLSKYIDPERPFYGLRALGRDGKERPHTSVEEMAAYYIQEIKTVQPEGPYLLGGRCTGGTIALEMAQQLKKKSQDVLLVVMVDSPRPLVTEAEKAEYLSIAACEENRKKWMETLIKIGSDFSQGKFDFSPEVFKYGIQIPADYTPHVYDGEIAYFVAQDNGSNCFLSNLIKPQAWANFVSNPILINEVPGNHLSMTKEPNIEVLASKLSSCLDEANLITKQHDQDANQPNFKQDLKRKGYK